MSEFSNLSSLKLLRSVDLLSRLTILQLSHIADSLLEMTFSDGQTIVDEVLYTFYPLYMQMPSAFFSQISIFTFICRMRTSLACISSRKGE